MPVLSLRLKSSPQIAALLIFLHGFSLCCLVVYSYFFLIKALLIVLVLVHGFYTHRYYAALLNTKSTQAVELNSRGEWLLHQAQGYSKAQLLTDSFITQYLIILNFKTTYFLKTNVLLMRDSVSAEEWRKLRVYLGTH